MNRVVVFGKPGGGKSTLSKKLSAATGVISGVRLDISR